MKESIPTIATDKSECESPPSSKEENSFIDTNENSVEVECSNQNDAEVEASVISEKDMEPSKLPSDEILNEGTSIYSISININ